jgi:hypothetical protein
MDQSSVIEDAVVIRGVVFWPQLIVGDRLPM